ncbi:MAG: HEAT repeat domain-containing protein [Nitrospira sp.]|nr:MAG: HEAT repeat domain-containing protein [Nitrospira sp.]
MNATRQHPQGLSPEEEQKELDFKVRVELLKSEDEALRENAAVELGCVGDLRAVEPLMEALRDKEWPVRFAAAESLAHLPDVRAVGALVECIADNHGGVRDKAGCALQAIGEPAVEPLIAALNHERAEVRKQVIYILGELRRILGEPMDLHAAEPMLNALKDPVPAVREAAAACVREFKLSHAEVRVVEALKDERFGTRFYSVQKLTDVARSSDSGKDSALPHLIGAIEDPQIGPVAAEGLGTIGDPRAVEPLLASIERDDMRQIGVTALLRIGEPSVLPLIGKMKSENPALRAEVAWGLGMLRDPRAVEALAAASEDEAAEVRRNAVMALGLIRDARAVEPLLKALADDSLAEEAKDSLVPIGEPAVEPLLAKLEGSSGRLRRDILWVLGMIRDRRAVESLIVALKDDDPEIRAVAIQGLGFVRDERGVAPLIEAMREDRFANNVVQALADIGEPAVEPLIAAMESSEQDLLVRQKAAKTLGMIKDARAVDPLIHALQDPVLRHAAATALVEFRTVATVRLIEVMHDENPDIRAHAAAALGHLMDGQALPALLLATGDPEPSVRAQAARALGRMEDRRALPELIAALKDSDCGVRVEAVRALGFLKEKQAVGPLIELFADDELRGDASEALFQIGVPAVEPLIAALAKPDADAERPSESSPAELESQPAVKSGEAGAVVVEAPPSKSLESVIPVSFNPEPSSDAPERERESGREAQATEMTEPAGELEESASDNSWMRRKEAAWTLGMIRDKRAVEPLIAALKRDLHQVRMSAIEALGRMEAEAAVAALIDVVKTDGRLRKLAAESLILIGDPAYHPVFALKESELDPDLRAVAMWILEGIGRLACEADEQEAAGPSKDLIRELDEIY